MFFNKTLVALSLISSVLCFSQAIKTSPDFKLEFGKEYTPPTHLTKQFFVNGNDILSINCFLKLYVESIDAENLESLDFKEIKYGQDLADKRYHEDFVQNGDKVYQLYNEWDKKNKTENILIRDFDIKTLEISNVKTLFSSNLKMKSSILVTTKETLEGVDKIDVFKSENKRNILIKYDIHEKSTTTKEPQIGLVVLNENMSIAWKKVVTMPLPEKEILGQEFFVNDFGEVFIINTIRQEKDKAFQCLKYSNASASPKKFTFNSNREVKLNLYPFRFKWYKNELYMAACNAKIFNDINSVYLAVLNRDCRLKREVFFNLPDETLYTGIPPEKITKLKDKGRSALRFIYLDNIFVADNGDITISGEHYSGLSESVEYGNILTFKISKDDKLVWSHVMRKLQNGYKFSRVKFFGYSKGANQKKNEGLSYKHVKVGGYHYLIYKDAVENIDLPLDGNPKAISLNRKGVIMALKINDKTGEASKEVVCTPYDLNNKSYSFYKSDWLIELQNGKYIFPLVNTETKKYVFLRLNIDN